MDKTLNERNKLVDARDLLKSNAYIILDTNVLLNIYRYSPEFTEFAMNCLSAIKSKIVLPATVKIEYEKHCDAEFTSMNNRVKNFGNKIVNNTKSSHDKINNMCEELERLHFPGIGELKNDIQRKLEEVTNLIVEYKDNHNDLKQIVRWEDGDHLKKFINSFGNNQIMTVPTYFQIYEWCCTGEDRFKKEIPPGFKDKTKEGITKYCDLILWIETMEFAKEKKADIIFVTDDVKADWWETDDQGKKNFHRHLQIEFSKTKQKICPLTSPMFYNLISSEYKINKVDAVELALNMTDEDYCKIISEEVFDYITDSLVFACDDFVDSDTASIGTEGLEEVEIADYKFLSAERILRSDSYVTYQFKYNVHVSGYSYDYWGRDDDTKEIIKSPAYYHELEGPIWVNVEREAATFIDFEDDNTFENAKIICGEMKEIVFKSWEDHEQFEYGEYGNCPDCGAPLNFENDGGNGFCINCTSKH